MAKDSNGANLGFETQLWAAADKMRGHMDAAEYKHVVLGLIFLSVFFAVGVLQFPSEKTAPFRAGAQLQNGRRDLRRERRHPRGVREDHLHRRGKSEPRQGRVGHAHHLVPR